MNNKCKKVEFPNYSLPSAKHGRHDTIIME